MAWGQSAVNESNPRPQRVLIVEDDPRLLLAISDVLSDEGYETREALSFAAVQMRSIWLPPAAIAVRVPGTECPGGEGREGRQGAILEEWALRADEARGCDRRICDRGSLHDSLRLEACGDRPGRPDGHGTGRARDRIAAAPAIEEGKEVRSRREGHDRAVWVGARAVGPAIDLVRRGGAGAGGDGAVTGQEAGSSNTTPHGIASGK